MKRLLLLVAVTAGGLVLMFGHADAISVTFLDNDNATPPLLANVSVVGTNVSFTTFTAPTGESVTVDFSGAFLAASQPATQTLGLTELGVPSGPVSDVIEVTKTSTGIRVVFTSDSPGVTLPTCAVLTTCQPEFTPGTTSPPPEGFFSFTIFNAGGAVITGGLQIQAFSDPDVVPEPTTLLLLGSGLVGLGALRYKRTRGR